LTKNSSKLAFWHRNSDKGRKIGDWEALTAAEANYKNLNYGKKRNGWVNAWVREGAD
jgi:hypothetical protein